MNVLSHIQNFLHQADIVRVLQRAFVCGMAWMLSSCVSAEKYNEMETSRNTFQQCADSLQRMVQEMTRTMAQMDTRLADAARDAAQMNDQFYKRGEQLDSINRLAADLLDRYTALSSNYNQLKSTSAKETQRLLGSLEQAQKDVNTRSSLQRETEDKLKAREQRLKEVEQKLQARDAALQALRTKISEALVGVKEGDLSVETRGGKVYVSLSNRLLFASGSTQIEAGGKQALKQLAAALNRQPDINIIVEGHTDDAKILNTSGAIKDNWDLSVMRATEVIRFLTADGKVESKRITASGRGEYAPLEAGSTPEIRAKNRRTEIILTPKLDELFEVLQPAKAGR
jgi:chemotaxis protein MotB